MALSVHTDGKWLVMSHLTLGCLHYDQCQMRFAGGAMPLRALT